MNFKLRSQFTIHNSQFVEIGGSKSETNRALLLQALFPEIELVNTSDSDDSRAMKMALSSNSDVIDIKHAGTAMRFLTAYFAATPGRTVTITGSARMKERPIKILVDALRQLGARIEYVENEGFPPLHITGQNLTKHKVSVKADVSSQFLSALLLIAPKLENGLELTIEGQLTSRPYLEMTVSLLNQIGIKTTFDRNVICVGSQFKIYNSKFIIIESDWSSASYYYSIIALSAVGTEITLSSFKKNSIQGDSALAEIYQSFGVETKFADDTILLSKTDNRQPTTDNHDLSDTPDIAQTIAVTCLGLGVKCRLTGLKSLKIKETDRLEALKNELSKFGAKIFIDDDSLQMEPVQNLMPNVSVKTYNDHRMAMAFAPLALKVPLAIENPEVVSKSYPGFWDDLRSIGFQMSTQS